MWKQKIAIESISQLFSNSSLDSQLPEVRVATSTSVFLLAFVNSVSDTGKLIFDFATLIVCSCFLYPTSGPRLS